MDNLSNLEIVQQVYKDFAVGNMQAVLSHFDKEVEWVRPGYPEIPFSGKFKGFEELGKMFSLVGQNIRIKSFLPKKFLSNNDTVAVIGEDKADVIATGKSYLSEWVYVYTLKNSKIVFVQVYLDTLELSEAFKP